MFKSLRWRLPFNYATIALIATIVLGAVLLITLQRFYRQQELDYLAGNAQAIGERIVPVVQEMDIGKLQATIKGLAFLSQTRVKVVTADNSLLLADSGDPRLADANTKIGISVEVDGVEQVFDQTFPSGLINEVLETTIEVKPGFLNSEVDQTLRTQVVTKTVDLMGENEVIVEHESLDNPGTITRTTIITRESSSDALPVVGTQFGFGFADQPPSRTATSNLVVRRAIVAEDGRQLGYVELSQGPAYGRDILQRTFWGWLIASLVAVFLAGLAGWLMSRRLVRPLLTLTGVTTQMAAGDLAARTNVQRVDELGTLGHSFNQMADQVEGKIKILRQFVADAAHELHTPLTALQTDLQLLSASDDPVQQQRVERAQSQAERLQALADSLLELSRLEAESSRRERALIDLNQLVQTIGELYASQAEQADLDFEMKLSNQSIMVPGDDSHLQRALVNVLDNSLKFTPPPGAIVLSLGMEEATAVISVRDTGIGILSEDLPQLFSRFHRGRNTAGYTGNGLGLAIVQEIMMKHNGLVSIQSGEWGTEVQLILPGPSASFE